MLRDGEPFFVDYQGGRKGALQYDPASILFDAKADLPPELRQQLLDYYLDQLGGFIPLDRSEFMRHYYAYVYVRVMQASGSLRVSRILRAQAALSAECSLRAEESALAAPQCRTAHCAANSDGSVSRRCWPRRNCRPSLRKSNAPATHTPVLGPARWQCGFSVFHFTAAARRRTKPAMAADSCSMAAAFPTRPRRTIQGPHRQRRAGD